MASVEELQKENEMLRFILLHHRDVVARSNAVRALGEEGCLEPGSLWTTETMSGWRKSLIGQPFVVVATGDGTQVLVFDNGNEGVIDRFVAPKYTLSRVGNCIYRFPTGHPVSLTVEYWQRVGAAARLFDQIAGR